MLSLLQLRMQAQQLHPGMLPARGGRGELARLAAKILQHKPAPAHRPPGGAGAAGAHGVVGKVRGSLLRAALGSWEKGGLQACL